MSLIVYILLYLAIFEISIPEQVIAFSHLLKYFNAAQKSLLYFLFTKFELIWMPELYKCKISLLTLS